MILQKNWVRLIKDCAYFSYQTSLTPIDLNRRILLVFDPLYFLKSLKFQLSKYFQSPKKIILDSTSPKPPGAKEGEIVHFISNVEVGGSQKIIFDIISGLGGKYNMYLADIKSGYLFKASERKFEKFLSSKGLLHKMNLINPNIIHFHYYGDVYNMHSHLKVLLRSVNTKAKIIENANNPIQAYLHKRIKKYIFVSKYVKNLRNNRHLKGAVIYPGVDMNLYKPKRYKKFPGRNVGLVYRLTNDKLDLKTIEILIEIVKKSKGEAIIHVVGDGPNFHPYLQSVQRMKVRSNFRFYGAVKYEDLPKIYDKFDIFVAPVHSESYGLVVPYAMAKNIPVVATKVGALPEILGNKGLLCKNYGELIDKTSNLLLNKGLRDKISKGSRKRARKLFSLEKMLSGYEKQYKKLIK